MKFYVLGSAGWIPAFGCETNCQLIEHSGKLIMLDAGTGVANLAAYSDVLARYDTIHVVLGHYHLDHIIGVSYMSNFLRLHNIVFYTPSTKYYRESGRQILDKLLSPEFFARRIDTIGANVEFESYDENGFHIGDIKISVREQKHSAPSFAFIIDGIFAYVTDTICNAETFDWARETRAMFHECWDIQKTALPHTSLEELKIMSDKYPTIQLFLMHKNPNILPSEYLDGISDSGIAMLNDGMVLEF